MSDHASTMPAGERLAAEEEAHWKLLRSTLDYLDETGNWFMAQERWSFDGCPICTPIHSTACSYARPLHTGWSS